jgi:hypothetical protein
MARDLSGRAHRAPVNRQTSLFRLAFLLSCWTTADHPLLAQPLRVPPAPESVSVEVERGGTVLIPLRSANRGGYRLNFLIRSAPAKGAIKKVRRIDDISAELVYQHDSRNGLDADEFTYAVQGDGTAVSARGKITVRVRRPTSHLEYPRTVAMGSIPAGLPSIAEIVFSNSGKADALLYLKAPPWATLESKEIRIPASSEARARLSVLPQGAGHLSGLVEIEGDTKGAVTFSAEGFPPIEVNPPSLKLESASPGTLNVRNVSNRVLTLAIGAPAGIVPLGSVTVKPGEARRLDLSLAKSAPASAEDLVSIRAGEFVLRIPVAWSRSSARIIFEGEAPFDLGELRRDRPVQGNLILRNVGEVNASVRVTAKDSWIILPTQDAAIQIAPGETKTLVISGIADRIAGERRGSVAASWDSGTSEMPVKASVRMDTAEASPTQAVTEDGSGLSRQAQEDKRAAIDRDELARMVARDRLKVISAETFPGKVHLKWRDPSPEPRTYRIEFRRPKPAGSVSRPVVAAGTKSPAEELLVFQDSHSPLESENEGRVISVWREVSQAKIKQVAPQTIEAILTGLGKGSLLSLRIIPIEANGRPSPVHTLLSIPLKPPPPPWWSWWQVRALAVALLLVVAGWLILRGRAIFEIWS